VRQSTGRDFRWSDRFQRSGIHRKLAYALACGCEDCIGERLDNAGSSRLSHLPGGGSISDDVHLDSTRLADAHDLIIFEVLLLHASVLQRGFSGKRGGIPKITASRQTIPKNRGLTLFESGCPHGPFLLRVEERLRLEKPVGVWVHRFDCHERNVADILDWCLAGPSRNPVDMRGAGPA
jgi:hypothetical protein